MNFELKGRVEIRPDGKMVYHEDGKAPHELSAFESALTETAYIHKEMGMQAYLAYKRWRAWGSISLVCNVLMLAIFYLK